MKKTMKKVIAYVCAITMVIASMVGYQATDVKAADITVDGVTYTVGDATGSYVDLICQGAFDGVRFGFAWSGATTVTSANAAVTIEQNGTVVKDLGTRGNGMSLYADDFAGIPAGSYTIVFTGTGDFTAQKSTVPLTISGEVQSVPELEVVDGEELLKGTNFTDADTTTDESSTEALWMELSQDNVAVYTNNGDGSVSVSTPAYESGDNWATQLKQNQVQLIQGKWYTAKMTVTSNVDKSIQLLIQQNVDWTVFAQEVVAVAAGETEEVEITFQATQTTNKVLFGIMMGYVNDTACQAANVTISNVSFKGYNSNPNGGDEPSDDETTTPEDSGEEPSDGEATTPEPEQGEQNENTYAAGFADLMNQAFLLGDVGAGQYKAVCGNGLISNIVNIQQPDGATEPGIYVAFKDASFGSMTVNGVTLERYIDGAGIVMYLSNFEYMYSDVVVMNGDGSQKAVIYVYNAQGIDNSDKTLEAETPEPGDEPVQITLQRLPATNAHQEFGSYKIAANPNLEAYAGINPNNRDNLQVKNATGPSSDNFSITRAFKGLEAGKKYVLSVDITPSVANGSYKTLKDADYKVLQEGTTTVSMVSTAYEVNGVTQADFTMYANRLGADVVLDISNPQYRLATDEDLTTTEPTTPSIVDPTTPEVTTPDEKPSDDTTTVDSYAPTTEAPTTVAPADESTTVDPALMNRPGKTKINKATKKAKKLSLKIAKVKGATGYEVYVYKTKKLAKKNDITKAIASTESTKIKIKVKAKAIKKAKKVFVRVRAYVDVNGEKVTGKWSKVKKVK